MHPGAFEARRHQSGASLAKRFRPVQHRNPDCVDNVRGARPSPIVAPGQRAGRPMPTGVDDDNRPVPARCWMVGAFLAGTRRAIRWYVQ